METDKVTFQLQAKLALDQVESDYATRWVCGLYEDDEKIGVASLTLFYLRRMVEDGVSLHDISSPFDMGLATIVEALPVSADVLYIERVRLEPKWRGRGLGITFVERILKVLGPSCCTAILVPAPLGGGPDEAVAKLAAHWGSMGFERVGLSDYYAKRISPPLADEDLDYGVKNDFCEAP